MCYLLFRFLAVYCVPCVLYANGGIHQNGSSVKSTETQRTEESHTCCCCCFVCHCTFWDMFRRLCRRPSNERRCKTSKGPEGRDGMRRSKEKEEEEKKNRTTDKNWQQRRRKEEEGSSCGSFLSFFLFLWLTYKLIPRELCKGET